MTDVHTDVYTNTMMITMIYSFAAPYIWNKLPRAIREPHPHLSLSTSPSHHHAHATSPFSSSPLSPSIIPSLFHSRVKSHLFTNHSYHSLLMTEPAYWLFCFGFCFIHVSAETFTIFKKRNKIFRFERSFNR